MKLNSIVIAVTNEYDPEYKVQHEPPRKWQMSLMQIRRLVDEAAELGCRLVIFSGGEPFLLGEILEYAVKYAAFKVPTVRVVTDCYWASTPHKAMETIGRMYQSGLGELDVRFSDWNQEPKRQQWVKWATMAAEKAGLILFSSHLMDRTKNSLHLVHMKQYPSKLKETYGEALESGELQSHLRPVSLLPYDPQAKDEPASDELLFLQQIERSHCPYIFNSVTAHPDGKLTACGGEACAVAEDLNLGDWFTSPLKDLIEAGHRNPLLQWIRISGPVAIRDFVASNSPDVEFQESYASLCHLCCDLLTRYETKRVVHEHANNEAQQAISRKIEHLGALRSLIAAGADSGSGLIKEPQPVA